MKHIQVAAAVIIYQDRILCVQRGLGKQRSPVSFKYEFPGGKLENGEAGHTALMRELQEELHRYMNAAQSGTVLISPAISPGEKRVMRTAFDAKFPTVVIMENGFTPLSKPHGEQFYACAEGRLLMLSPWPHHNDHQKITAQQCQAMNLMALELATLES